MTPFQPFCRPRLLRSSAAGDQNGTRTAWRWIRCNADRPGRGGRELGVLPAPRGDGQRRLERLRTPDKQGRTRVPVASRCVDTSAAAHVPVASVADRAEPLCSATKSRRACVWVGGSGRLTHRGVAHVRSPGSPTGAAQCVLRLGRPSSLGWLFAGIIRSNRRGTDPYARFRSSNPSTTSSGLWHW